MTRGRIAIGLAIALVAGAVGLWSYFHGEVSREAFGPPTSDGELAIVRVWNRAGSASYLLEQRGGAEWSAQLPWAAALDSGVEAEGLVVVRRTSETPDAIEDGPIEPTPSGECAFDLATGVRTMCIEHPSAPRELAFEHGVLVAVLAEPWRVEGYHLREGTGAYSTRIPEPDADRVWIARAADAIGIRADEAYFVFDPETGAVERGSPEDATALCAEGDTMIVSAAGELRATAISPLAWAPIARPGPGVLVECTATPDGIAGTWCATSGPIGEPGPAVDADWSHPITHGCMLFHLSRERMVQWAIAVPWASGLEDLSASRESANALALSIHAGDAMRHASVDLTTHALMLE